jgi:queuine/archaeosine tRNA-ribosyltransferase
MDDFRCGNKLFLAAIVFVRSANKSDVQFILDELKTINKTESALYNAVQTTIERCNNRLKELEQN